MKIAITVPWTARLGGAEEMLWTFLTHLDQSRVTPLVVFLVPGEFEREVAHLGYRTAVIPAGRLRQARGFVTATRRLARLFEVESPDLVINWSAKAQIYGAVAARLAGMSDRVVWWQHGVTDGHWMDRLATALPSRAIGFSSHVSREAQTRLRPRRDGFVVHPGVKEPEPHAGVVAEIPGNRCVIGIVGRLQPWKGQHRFVRMIGDLRASGLDVHGLIVGGEAHGFSKGFADEVANLISQCGLEKFVTMTGQVDRPEDYVARMDVMVSASEFEPFGIVIVEAMMQRVPVVAVADAGPREILVHGESGMLAPSPSHEDLSEAVAHLVRDPALRARIGHNGRVRAKDVFAADRMAAQIVAELDAILPREPRVAGRRGQPAEAVT